MFVRNDSGTVHSVPDGFDLPEDWEEVTEAEAPAQLLGHEVDPAVQAVELHDLSDSVVVDESGPAKEPGVAPDGPSNDIQPPAVVVKSTPEVTA